jgi:hypothetical protein
MIDSNLIPHNNSNKDSDGYKNRTIQLEISRELQKEKIVSEIKYTAALECLKIKFTKYYDNQIVHLPVDIKNWYAWAGNLKAMIRRRVESLDDNDYLLIEDTILDNLYLIHEANENHSQRILENKQREEVGGEGKTIHLKKYAFEGKLYELTSADKNPKFIAICLPSFSSPTDSSSNNDGEDMLDGKTTDKKNELSTKIDVTNDHLLTTHPIPYSSSADSKEEQKNYIKVANKIKNEEESSQIKQGGAEL